MISGNCRRASGAKWGVIASPSPGLGGKLGLDATNKLGPETSRDWGRVLAMTPEVTARVDALWHELGLP